MWADQACTIRPVVGEVYDYLYVQFKRTYGFGQVYVDGEQIVVSTPDEEYPEEPYYVQVYVDWNSIEYSEPFRAGTVVECSCSYAYPIEPDWKFSFDPIT